MKKRIFLVGLAGGLLVSRALNYPLYRYLPSQFVEGWPSADGQVAIVCLALAGILLLVIGFVSGLMSGARNRLGAMGAGAAAGLTASLLAELLVIGAAAGVWGARAILAHGLHATSGDAEYLQLLAWSVSSILWWTYLSIWIAGGAGLLLGGLGGLAAGNRSEPAHPQSGLWLNIAAAGTLASSLNLIVMVSVYVLLESVLQNVADEIAEGFMEGYSLPYPSTSILSWAAATSLVWLIFWQFVAWRVLRSLPASRSMTFLFVGAALLLVPVGLLPLLYYLNTPTMIVLDSSGSALTLVWQAATILAWLASWQFVASYILRRSPASRKRAILLRVALLLVPLGLLPILWHLLTTTFGSLGEIVIPVLVLAGGVLWAASTIQLRPRTKPLLETPFRRAWNRVMGLLERVGQARAAAVYFLFVSLSATLLVFLVDSDTFLLPWLTGGLLLNILFAALGLRAAWKSGLPPSGEPALPAAREFFAGASLGGSFFAFLSLLNCLAPLSLVLLPIVMIAPLSLYEESEVIELVQSQGMALTGIVQMNYTIMARVVTTAGVAVAVIAILLTAAGTIWKRHHLRSLPPETS